MGPFLWAQDGDAWVMLDVEPVGSVPYEDGAFMEDKGNPTRTVTGVAPGAIYQRHRCATARPRTRPSRARARQARPVDYLVARLGAVGDGNLVLTPSERRSLLAHLCGSGASYGSATIH